MRQPKRVKWKAVSTLNEIRIFTSHASRIQNPSIQYDFLLRNYFFSSISVNAKPLWRNIRFSVLAESRSFPDTDATHYKVTISGDMWRHHVCLAVRQLDLLFHCLYSFFSCQYVCQAIWPASCLLTCPHCKGGGPSVSAVMLNYNLFSLHCPLLPFPIPTVPPISLPIIFPTSSSE